MKNFKKLKKKIIKIFKKRCFKKNIFFYLVFFFSLALASNLTVQFTALIPGGNNTFPIRQ